MNTYRRAFSFLDSFLNLEQVAKPHSRIWNLKRMRKLLEIFSHPEKGLFVVVIAGTKGKGSTGYFLSEILRQSGLRVGFYHSPHLAEPRERIWINGQPVSRREFANGLLRIQKQVPKGSPYTYFELLTLLGCLLFKERRLDAAVFEAGMGGRLDATHALPAKLAVITPIHFDHEAYLGNTLGEIAREKAAVMPRGRDVVTAPQPPEVQRVILQTVRKRKCRLWRPLSLKQNEVGLLGDFQRLNASVACRAAAILRDRYHFPVTEPAIRRGIHSNHWPGRMEMIKGRPGILLDGAHNPKSIQALSRNLRRLFPKRRKILIFGTSRDKRSERMIPILAKTSSLCILTRANNPRAQELTQLLKEARPHFPVLIPSPSSAKALSLARKLARPSDLIVATGSFYLIGELRTQCRP